MSDLLYIHSEMNMPANMVVLPLRCTVVKLSNALIVISPIDFTKAQIEQIQSMGDVTEIVAPSLIHHLWLQKAMDLFPNATVWGVPDCEQKLPKIPWDMIFESDEWPYRDELDYVFLEGAPRLNEVAFLHKKSKTLIVCDLCFNLQQPKGWASPLMLRLLGTYKKFAVSRLLSRAIADQQALQESINNLMQWDFEKIAMGHGELVNSNGKQILADAFRTRGYSVTI